MKKQTVKALKAIRDVKTWPSDHLATVALRYGLSPGSYRRADGKRIRLPPTGHNVWRPRRVESRRPRCLWGRPRARRVAPRAVGEHQLRFAARAVAAFVEAVSAWCVCPCGKFGCDGICVFDAPFGDSRAYQASMAAVYPCHSAPFEIDGVL